MATSTSGINRKKLLLPTTMSKAGWALVEARDDVEGVSFVPMVPKAELQAIIAGATGRWRPVILVAVFCGLRASELRGLRWADVDFEGRQLSITQRADASHKIGRLKSTCS